MDNTMGGQLEVNKTNYSVNKPGAGAGDRGGRGDRGQRGGGDRGGQLDNRERRDSGRDAAAGEGN